MRQVCDAAYAHQITVLERMCTEATIVIGFRNAMAQEESDLTEPPDFFELKSTFDNWLVSVPVDVRELSPEQAEQRADRLSLGLEAR